MNPFYRLGVHLSLGLLLYGILVPLSHAEVTLDGSLGRSGMLDGKLDSNTGKIDFAITTDLGRQIGTNLFHSFGRFNLGSSESATFSGPDSVQNILGRVTGGQASTIDGLLRSEIPGANLFLLNPSGVMFGPHARLDVQGSFHASTADFLRLADGVRFNAVPSADDALLTTAPPSAFGFLNDNPAAIEVSGSDIEVPAGERLSLVGGDIGVASGRLIARNGRIDLVSVASKGEVSATAIPEVHHFERLGRIEITQTPGASSGSLVRVSEGGEGIFIRGGVFTLAGDSRVISTTDDLSARPGGPISIQAEKVALADGALIGSTTRDSSTGPGGAVSIQAGKVALAGGATIISGTVDSSTGPGGAITIRADEVTLVDQDTRVISLVGNFNTGQGGEITVQATNLTLQNHATLSSINNGTGQAGAITADVANLSLNNNSRLVSATSSTGRGGDITVRARESVRASTNNSGMGSITSGPGDAGHISVITPRLELEEFSGLTTGADNEGRPGDITIDVEKLVLRNGGLLASLNFGPIKGGDITVRATDSVLMTGRHAGAVSSEISSVTYSTGDAGRIQIATPRLRIEEGGLISVSFGFGACRGDSFGRGQPFVARGFISRRV
jgi:filamentous hemagglutinin family protein